MNGSKRITTLFLDIGGVLLTNGWDRYSRARAAETFQIDIEEFNQRHHLTFDTYELGRLSLDDYLTRTVFYEPRHFSQAEFRDFMFSQSNALPEMLTLMRELKERYGLNVVAVSNEGRELTNYRIDRFHLRSLFDAFVCSCFVHLRKPDAEIYRLALDLTQVAPDEVVYLDDRAIFVDVASKLGIRSFCHRDVSETRAQLASLGLSR